MVLKIAAHPTGKQKQAKNKVIHWKHLICIKSSKYSKKKKKKAAHCLKVFQNNLKTQYCNLNSIIIQACTALQTQFPNQQEEGKKKSTTQCKLPQKIQVILKYICSKQRSPILPRKGTLYLPKSWTWANETTCT